MIERPEPPPTHMAVAIVPVQVIAAWVCSCPRLSRDDRHVFLGMYDGLRGAAAIVAAVLFGGPAIVGVVSTLQIGEGTFFYVVVPVAGYSISFERRAGGATKGGRKRRVLMSPRPRLSSSSLCAAGITNSSPTPTNCTFLTSFLPPPPLSLSPCCFIAERHNSQGPGQPQAGYAQGGFPQQPQVGTPLQATIAGGQNYMRPGAIMLAARHSLLFENEVAVLARETDRVVPMLARVSLLRIQSGGHGKRVTRLM